MLYPDKSVLILVDNGAIVVDLKDSLLWRRRRGTRGTLRLEDELCGVLNTWNLYGNGLIGVGAQPAVEGDLVVEAQSRRPVGTGISDAQLRHHLADEIKLCEGFLNHMERAYPQTRFGDAERDDGVTSDRIEVADLLMLAERSQDTDPVVAATALREAIERAQTEGVELVPDALKGVAARISRARVAVERDLFDDVAQAMDILLAPPGQGEAADADVTDSGLLDLGSAGMPELPAVTLARVAQVLTGTGQAPQASVEQVDGVSVEDDGTRALFTLQDDQLRMQVHQPAADSDESAADGECLAEELIFAVAGLNVDNHPIGATLPPAGAGPNAAGPVPRDKGARRAGDAGGVEESRDVEAPRVAHVVGYGVWCLEKGATDPQLADVINRAVAEAPDVMPYLSHSLALIQRGQERSTGTMRSRRLARQVSL